MDLILKKAIPVICIALAAPLFFPLAAGQRALPMLLLRQAAWRRSRHPLQNRKIWQEAQLLLMKAGKPILKKAFGKITMSPRNTTKIWGMVSIRSTSKWMEKPCPMFA